MQQQEIGNRSRFQIMWGTACDKSPVYQRHIKRVWFYQRVDLSFAHFPGRQVSSQAINNALFSLDQEGNDIQGLYCLDKHYPDKPGMRAVGNYYVDDGLVL